MKNKYFLFSLIIIICFFSFIKVNGKEKPLANKIIYLDPGHGGADPGATYKNIKESVTCYLLLPQRLSNRPPHKNLI